MGIIPALFSTKRWAKEAFQMKHLQSEHWTSASELGFSRQCPINMIDPNLYTRRYSQVAGVWLMFRLKIAVLQTRGLG